MSELKEYWFVVGELSQAYHSKADVDTRLALMQQEAEANHKVPQQALDGCDRVDKENARLLDQIALMQRAIEWCLKYAAYNTAAGVLSARGPFLEAIEVPAEFAEILKPGQL